MNHTSFDKLAREMSGANSFGGSLIMIAITLLIALFLVWASFAELDNVTRGTGKVVSSAQNQVIQASESGVILERFVSENSAVNAGDVLLVLDPIDAIGELNRLNERLTALNIREERLRAEVDGVEFVAAPELVEASENVATTELSLYQARISELSGRLTLLREQLQQSEQEFQGHQLQAETSRRTAAFLQQEIDVVEPLVRENIAPATRLLELQRQLEIANGDILQANSAAERSRSNINQVEMEINNAEENFVLRALDELNQLVAEQSELEKAVPQLVERVSRTEIRAPMAGVVNRLNYRTIGGFVNRGDVILELVPTGSTLVIEARIQPQDISGIRIGDTVKIRLSAYDSAKYGTIEGAVTNISPDAVPDQDTGASSYVVDVSIVSELTLETGEVVTLMPGMTATVDILSGKRTVLEYLWQPVARVQELALRD